jgi:hypothetical protein
MIFRIIDDTIELDGLPVATILPSVWPTRRDYLEQTLEAYEPDHEADISAENAELKDRIRELEDRIDDLENDQ